VKSVSSDWWVYHSTVSIQIGEPWQAPSTVIDSPRCNHILAAVVANKSIIPWSNVKISSWKVWSDNRSLPRRSGYKALHLGEQEYRVVLWGQCWQKAVGIFGHTGEKTSCGEVEEKRCKKDARFVWTQRLGGGSFKHFHFGVLWESVGKKCSGEELLLVDEILHHFICARRLTRVLPL